MCIHTRTQTRTHTCTHVHIHTNTHTRTNTHTHSSHTNTTRTYMRVSAQCRLHYQFLPWVNTIKPCENQSSASSGGASVLQGLIFNSISTPEPRPQLLPVSSFLRPLPVLRSNYGFTSSQHKGVHIPITSLRTLLATTARA